MAVTGAQSYVQLGLEAAAWGTEAVTINTSFGRELSCKTQLRNNFIKERGINSRNVQAFIVGKFEGAVTVSGILSDGHWLVLALGTSATTSSGPYIHTFTEANTLKSITIEDGTDLATDSIRKYLGCILNRVTIAIDVGQPIRFSAEFFYKTETHGTTIDASPAAPAQSSMNFAQASIDLPSATTLTKIQRVEIIIEEGLIVDHEIGSRLPAAITPGERSYTINAEKLFENLVDFLQKAYGAAGGPAASITETATCVVNITNGLTTTSERHFVFTFTGTVLDSHDIEKKSGESTKENVPILMRSCSLVVEDATASTIFD